MAAISAAAVKGLREQTGAGMMDCKRALTDADGDVEKAVELLRERGLAKASKRQGRATTEGTIALAREGSQGAIVELGCETDFVAKTEAFQALADRLAAAMLAGGSLTDAESLLASELDGRKVEDVVSETVAKVGENVQVKRAARLDVGGAGVVGGYVHAGGRLGVLVGVRSDATGDAVEGLAKDLSMHVAAADPAPVAVDRDGVPGEIVEKEREIFRRQAEQEGKPEKVIDRIVEGKVGKFYSDICLVEQAFVKDPDRSINELLKDAAGKLGGEVAVTGFVRFRLGEEGTG